MKYYQKINGTIELAPFSSCGFFLFQYSAYLDIQHQFPVMLYRRDYKTLKYDDIDYTILKGDDGSNCFN